MTQWRAGGSSPRCCSWRTRGGERRGCRGFDAGGTLSRSAGPAPGAAGGGGRRTAAKVGHQQPRGVAGAGTPPSPLPYAARRGSSPASESPGGLWLLGVFSQWEDGAGMAPAPLPIHSPVPGQRSSRGRAMWHPVRQPGLGGTPAPSPWPWVCGVPDVPPGFHCCFSVPPPQIEIAPCPRPAGWTAQRGAPGGGQRGAGRAVAGAPRPPEQGVFIHNLMVYFQCYPWPCPGWCGGSCEQPPAAVSPPCPHRARRAGAQSARGREGSRRRPAPAIPRGRCFA